MIKTFKDKRTEGLFEKGGYKKIEKALAKKITKQLDRLNVAGRLEDLYFPPSNHFEALEGFNPTRYSIRINMQWRISFEWLDNDAYNVVFEDYH
ncbi:MAG: type II toxin-antitoxin system RelE/ParE family toxin [SAR324 cluster bacterium]|nr:type II toxin-antitoxin system RelE/ParE family toxin [SAR324 cluster bacterium]